MDRSGIISNVASTMNEYGEIIDSDQHDLFSEKTSRRGERGYPALVTRIESVEVAKLVTETSP